MSHHKMQSQRTEFRRAFCCTNCRISVSSSVEEGESSRKSDRLTQISTLAHYLVQERLDQMIKQGEEEQEQARRSMEARNRKQKMVGSSNGRKITSPRSRRKWVFVVAMEKSSNDPRHDFRRSMVEVILANKLQEPKDLRYLLNYYISMNSEEYRGVILEVFNQVCTDVFFSCKCL